MTDTRRGIVEEILAERVHQVEVQGWSQDHDDGHDCGELAWAAACYVAPSGRTMRDSDGCYVDAWPWSTEADKRDDHGPRRRLVIAGALIVAELERLNRVAIREATTRIIHKAIEEGKALDMSWDVIRDALVAHIEEDKRKG